MKKFLCSMLCVLVLVFSGTPAFGAFAYTKILEISTIPTDSSAVYTLGASTTAYIRLIVIHNSNTTAEQVTVWVVPNGDSADDTTQIYDELLAPSDTRIIELGIPGIIIDTAGDAVHGDATTGSMVTIQIMGGTE